MPDPDPAVAAREAFVGSLPEEIRAHPSLTKFTSVADLAKAHLEVQPLIGAEKIPVPGKDAAPEIWNTVYDRLGRPKAPTDYQLPQVTLPEGLSLPEADLTEFKAMAHKAGLLPSQVNGLFQWYAERQGAAFKQAVEASKAEMQTAEKALRTEWGTAYEAKMATAQKVLKLAAGEDFEKIGNAFGNNPVVVKALAKLGSMIGEDRLGEGAGAAGGKTPAEAVKEINAIMADPKHAYHIGNHPEHAASVEYVQSLFKMAHPS